MEKSAAHVLTEQDGAEHVRLLNELTSIAHSTVLGGVHIYYSASFVRGPGGWIVKIDRVEQRRATRQRRYLRLYPA